MAQLLSVRGLHVDFVTDLGVAHVLDGISLDVAPGEVVGLVGESGCGKTTLGRLVLRLTPPSAGRIVFDGIDITGMGEAKLRPLRRNFQAVLQDPFSSLDPRMTAGNIVGEPLRVHEIGSAKERRARVADIFKRVGLRAEQYRLFPSGGA